MGDVDVIVEPESVYYGEDGWLEVDLGITGWGSRPYPQFYLDTMLVCDSISNESHFFSSRYLSNSVFFDIISCFEN